MIILCFLVSITAGLVSRALLVAGIFFPSVALVVSPFPPRDAAVLCNSSLTALILAYSLTDAFYTALATLRLVLFLAIFITLLIIF